MHSIDELKQRLLHVWHGMDQSIIDSAVDEWRLRLRACVNTVVVYCEQYGIKKRDSDANVASLAARDDAGRKKSSSAGLSADLQANQGAFLPESITN